MSTTPQPSSRTTEVTIQLPNKAWEAVAEIVETEKSRHGAPQSMEEYLSRALAPILESAIQKWNSKHPAVDMIPARFRIKAPKP